MRRQVRIHPVFYSRLNLTGTAELRVRFLPATCQEWNVTWRMTSMANSTRLSRESQPES